MITPEMTIYDVLTTYPETVSVFTSHGMEKFADKEVVERLGPLLKLKTALKTKGLHVEHFIDKLMTTVKDSTTWTHTSLADSNYKTDHLKMLALMPCGMKMPFTKAFEKFSAQLTEETGTTLDYLIEGNVNHELSYYAYIDSINDIDELPDVIVTSDINSFFHKTFVDRFIKTGKFVDVRAGGVHPEFDEVGYPDPDGNYTMLSTNLLIMLVDKKELGDIPMPTKWEDLLQPEFEKKVAMRGGESFFCNGVLMPFYANFGIEGMKKLERSVCMGLHPSEMVKLAGSGKPNMPAVHIIPYFFAKTKRMKETTEIVWPEDGAMISPVLMLVKKEAAERVKPITDFLIGEEMGEICANAYFPSVNPSVTNKVEGNGSMQWLGWDFLNNNDIKAVKTQLDDEFKPLAT